MEEKSKLLEQICELEKIAKDAKEYELDAKEAWAKFLRLQKQQENILAVLHDKELHITNLEQSIEQVHDVLKVAQDNEAEFRRREAMLLHSTSWKITKPLRFFMKGTKKILKSTPGFKNLYSKLYRMKYGNPVIPVPPLEPTHSFLPLTEEKRKEEENFSFSQIPKISIIVPVFNTPLHFLHEMIQSVQKQTYKNWELCLGDASDTSHTEVSEICEEYAKADQRIRYMHLSKNEGISGNSNETMKMATGEYIGLLDHDDVLHYSALFEIVKEINKGSDFIYTDESTFHDHPSDAYLPHFKPDFAIDNLRANNYICHFTVFAKDLLSRSGGAFSSNFDGAQDHDLFLRLTENAEKIAHIPKVLYYWRAHAQSTALETGTKPYVISAGQRAVAAHLERIGLKGEVKPIPKIGTFYRVEYDVEEELVSILIPSMDHIDDLEKCINSVLNQTTYKNYEIIIIENNSIERKTFRYYEDLAKKEKIQVVTWDGPFNFSAINNFGATFAKGKYLIFLNNDTKIITPNWIQEMLMFAQRSDVGMVGAKLYYPDDTVQHAGIGIGILTLAGHYHRNFHKAHPGYMGRLAYANNVSAVTAACSLIRRDVFDEVGGFDESFQVAFNDVDLCLKVRKKGYLIVFTPFAELYHYESKSRGLDADKEKRTRFEDEVKRFQMKWVQELSAGDPYFNSNFSLDKEDFSYKIM